MYDSLGEADIVGALQAKDERAFAQLIDAYHLPMLRIAQLYVRDRSIAEEVVQEAWVGVLRGVHRFERRSTLKTWILRILVHIAKARAARERRSVPLSTVFADEAWDYGGGPDDHAISREMGTVIRSAIEELSSSQRDVVTLRDVNGWSAEEVRNVLQISETNQRVLLHRGRSRIRLQLQRYLGGARS